MQRHLRIVLPLVVLSWFALAEIAHAQNVRLVAGKAVKRVRRSVSFGPTGGAGLALASEGGADGVLSLGLGLFMFQDTLLDIDSMRSDIQARIQEKLRVRLTELGVSEAEIDAAELRQVRDEIWLELKAELRERLDGKPSPTPKPRFAIYAEGAYLPRADAWQARLGLGVGISRVTVGPTILGHFGGVNAFGVGPEIGFHYLIGAGDRPLGLQFFLRYDYFMNNRDALGHQGALGVRTFLDII